jgi:hypothetical protein
VQRTGVSVAGGTRRRARTFATLAGGILAVTGLAAVFRVSRLGQFPKNAFPTRAVYGHTSRRCG